MLLTTVSNIDNKSSY